MRRWSLEKYQDGNKHIFSGKVERFGSFTDKESGKKIDTVLITNLTGEDNKELSDHVWITDRKIAKYELKKGLRYTFRAKVGTYRKGRSVTDYQLKSLSQFAIA